MDSVPRETANFADAILYDICILHKLYHHGVLRFIRKAILYDCNSTVERAGVGHSNSNEMGIVNFCHTYQQIFFN